MLLPVSMIVVISKVGRRLSPVCSFPVLAYIGSFLNIVLKLSLFISFPF